MKPNQNKAPLRAWGDPVKPMKENDTAGEVSRKIGRNRGKRRIWLEGVCLAAFGWTKGTRFNATFENGSIVYEQDDNGARAVAGDERRPVIDTNTDKIGESLGADAEQVKVSVSKSRIVVKVAALALALASVFFNVLPANAQRVLVACEFSGIVRDEFRQAGHDAISCDLLPTEKPGDHITGDLLEVLDRGCFDLVLAFPPCTYLCSSALWRCGEKHDPNGERSAKREQALQFVQAIMDCGAPKIAIENPVGAIGTRIRPADQILQPYDFGHDASKKTCIWLKGLKPLEIDPAQYVAPRIVTKDGKQFKRWSNQTDSGQNRLTPGENRWKDRSRTYAGIARSMAHQWGSAPGKPSTMEQTLLRLAC